MTKVSIFVKQPQNFQKVQISSIFFFLLLSLATATDISYSQHCDDVVREYPSSATPILHFNPLRLRGHVSGDENSHINPTKYSTKTLRFLTQRVYGTENDAVFKLFGVLSIETIRIRPLDLIGRRGLRLVHFRPPRIPVDSNHYQMKLSLNGFWNSTSGKLCMVGSDVNLGRFVSNSHVVLKLDYLNSSNINTCLVNGTLKSLDIDDKNAYFDPISITGINTRFYEYKLIKQETERKAFNRVNDSANVSLRSNLDGITYLISGIRSVELVNKSNCDVINCNPLVENKDDSTPSMKMHLERIEDLGRLSEKENVRYVLSFGMFEYFRWFRSVFDPKVMLISEGKWDKEKNRLDIIACRISDISINDCSIRLSLRMPLFWTLRERYAIVGEMWSTKGVNESGYFSNMELRSSPNTYAKGEGLKYEYTEIENVKKHFPNQMIQQGKDLVYPTPLSSDMRIDMLVNPKGKRGNYLNGYSSPLTVGDKFYQQTGFSQWSNSPESNNSNRVNMSYVMNIRKSYNNLKSYEISGEGLYDSKNGHLCMIGCKYVNVTVQIDCEILINIQYASINSKGGTKGSIKSMRKKSDSLYFEPLEISSRSVYKEQVRKSIWRMDLEITMVLISNTFTCIFVGLQLFYVKKNPNIVPFISIIMLLVLTLAHLIPLLLNFEAMFLRNRNKQNLYLGNDGLLEVNEILVRVITMIAFLLEFRLLQLIWYARNEDSNKKSLWVSDKNTLYLSLPLYISGVLITLLCHYLTKRNNIIEVGFLDVIDGVPKQSSLYGGLKSYVGLILDGFLLPQILFNMFYDTREKALAGSFYVGTTFVRLLPHGYDLYRAHSSNWEFSYIYANPRMDYYSTGWDIVISVMGLLFVIVIFLQQRFGGRCFLPKRFKQSALYEKVPAVSSEQL